MKTRIGKIARLPRAVRDQLNRRLQNGEQAKRLVEWLNNLPEVQAALAVEFHGRPIREQNISEWKKGGYREWQLQQDALEMVPLVAAEAGQLKKKVDGALSGHMAVWITAHLMAVVRRLAAGDLKDAAKWKLLHEACGDLVALRRGDQNAEWMEIERERLMYLRQDSLGRHKRRIVTGLDTLLKYVNEKHPEAKAAWEALAVQCASPIERLVENDDNAA